MKCVNEKVDFDGFSIQIEAGNNGELVVFTHVKSPPHPNYKTPQIIVERGSTHIIGQGDKRLVVSNL